MVGLCHGRGVGEVVLVCPDIRSRQDFAADIGCKGRCREDLLCKLQAPNRHVAVMRVGPVVRVNERRVSRICRGEPDCAARTRSHVSRIESDTVLLHSCDSRFDSGTET